ncbi:SCAN domain-containing protein 3-like [Spodoptera litura]|uniref:SCAN domain-containing protein 3-like n=1 Tax=Spodoptera litura TaxID=69820 RepID=A0A9J7E7L5_SPOLT|nr:SCAN domain-containing protein 3-like [Spodoptera litura]
MAPKRKYDNNYIKFGFTSIESNGEIKPQCVICATVLANEALKPAKLKRHLETVHPDLCNRPLEFFQGKLEVLKKMKLGPSGSRFATSEKLLVASFEISKLIVQSKKPHTVGETLVKPCLIKAVEEVLGLEVKKKIQDIPLSNNTVKARIELMSSDIEEQLVSRIKKSPFFALQCDESTDISNCCQLLVFVRFLDDDNIIKEELLISRELDTTSKGIDVMNSISEFFEKHNLMWDKLAALCTDGAPAMLGSRSGLATLVKQKNPNVITTHCIIHRQALASKTLPGCLNDTLKIAIKIVNLIKSSALNTRLFKKLCTEMDSDHETLLFHTEVRWLSKGNMLGRLYELRAEVEIFLGDKKNNDLLKQFTNLACQMDLAYLVDIFTHLNKLNIQLQGSGNKNLENVANIFIFEDKLRAFICKLQLWLRKIEENNYSAFATLQSLVEDKKYDAFTANIQENIKTHLHMLIDEFNRYFPEYNEEANLDQKMIRNPFSTDASEVTEEIQEELIELQNDRNCKDAFESNSLESFWCKKALSYTKLREIALRYFIVFSTTYLCEQGFSALIVLKNKTRNRLKVSDDLRVALSNNISPRIAELVKKMQAQKSH